MLIFHKYISYAIAAGACLVDPLVDPDGADAGLAGHGVDQRHLAAVGAELPGLHHVQGGVSRVFLNIAAS